MLELPHRCRIRCRLNARCSRRSPPSLTDTRKAKPFSTAEEAWFWYVRCQNARRDGARFENRAGAFCRPCEPDDLYRAVKRLALKRIIGREHLEVLSHFGFQERAPDPRCREEEKPFAVWDEALDRLSSILKAKEIVE